MKIAILGAGALAIALTKVIDDEKNESGSDERIISKEGPGPVILVVPTNEELSIAMQTVELVK